jgi:hypothetical protein
MTRVKRDFEAQKHLLASGVVGQPCFSFSWAQRTALPRQRNRKILHAKKRRSGGQDANGIDEIKTSSGG